MFNLIQDFLPKNVCSISEFQKDIIWGNFTINHKELIRKGCFQGDFSFNNKVPWLRCQALNINKFIQCVV